MYLFYNLCTTLHVSNDHFVHHQQFKNLLHSAALYKPCKRVYLLGLTVRTGFVKFTNNNNNNKQHSAAWRNKTRCYIYVTFCDADDDVAHPTSNSPAANRRSVFHRFS